MNDVLFNIDPQENPAPLEASRLHALSLPFVVKLGQELYAEHPLLQKTHPEMAQRLAILLAAKQPDLNAALFVSPSVGCDPLQAGLTQNWLMCIITSASPMRKKVIMTKPLMN